MDGQTKKRRRLTPEEKWEKAGLSDAFIFYKVMTKYPDACRHLVELLLHIQLERIEILGEQTVAADALAKGIRLDLYIKGGGRVFDMELQARDTKEFPERARYYQGAMDVDSLRAGQPYRELREAHVAFICMDDVFGRGLPVYTFENVCREDGTVRLGDKSYKHFFVARNYGKMSENEELRLFLELLATGNARGGYTQELARYTAEVKRSVQERRQYMDWERQRFYDFEDGMEKGFSDGIRRQADETAERMLRSGKLTDSDICAMTGISVDELERIRKGL